jgi:predicted DNA-binding antitoxin AbrB/MazE fold protein
MTQTVEAVYDGVVLRPTVALALEPNTRVRLIVEAISPVKPSRSFLQTARQLSLEGPTDWSANLDTYLYGDGDLSR